MPAYYTPQQKGIIKRYYDNKDNLAAQKLSDIVSELYLCTDAKKTERMWNSARTALRHMNVPPGRIDACIQARDLKQLADMVNELF